MALIKCVECGKEISSEAAACPACGKGTKTGQVLAKKTSTNFISVGAILGVVIGGGIGYSLAPAIPMFGRIPFIHVITCGTLLKGLDAMLVPYAQAGFRSLMFGLIGGYIVGRTVASLLAKAMHK